MYVFDAYLIKLRSFNKTVSDQRRVKRKAGASGQGGENSVAVGSNLTPRDDGIPAKIGHWMDNTYPSILDAQQKKIDEAIQSAPSTAYCLKSILHPLKSFTVDYSVNLWDSKQINGPDDYIMYANANESADIGPWRVQTANYLERLGIKTIPGTADFCLLKSSDSRPWERKLEEVLAAYVNKTYNANRPVTREQIYAFLEKHMTPAGVPVVRLLLWEAELRHAISLGIGCYHDKDPKCLQAPALYEECERLQWSILETLRHHTDILVKDVERLWLQASAAVMFPSTLYENSSRKSPNSRDLTIQDLLDMSLSGSTADWRASFTRVQAHYLELKNPQLIWATTDSTVTFRYPPVLPEDPRYMTAGI